MNDRLCYLAGGVLPMSSQLEKAEKDLRSPKAFG